MYSLCNLCAVQLVLEIVQITNLELQEKEESSPSFHPLITQSPALVLKETGNDWGWGKGEDVENKSECQTNMYNCSK